MAALRLVVISCVLLAGTALGAETKSRVVVLDLNVLDTSAPGAEAERIKRLASIINEQVLAELSSTGLVEVIGSSDLATMLGLERQKQLLGCTPEATSCLAELTGALGAPLVVAGSLARAGGQMRLDLKLLRTADAKVLSRRGELFEQEAEVFTLVPRMVASFTGEISKLGTTPSAPVPAGRLGAWVTIGVGAAAAIAGGSLLIVQSANSTSLTTKLGDGSIAIEQAVVEREAIYGQRTAGAVLVGAGLAAAAGGVLWRVLLKEDAGTATIAPLNGGVLLSWSATW